MTGKDANSDAGIGQRLKNRLIDIYISVKSILH